MNQTEAPRIATSRSATPTTGLRRALGWLTALGTLPYLTLKAMWLTGFTVGVPDPVFLTDPAIVAANAVTFVLDLTVVVLAFALTHSWGQRLPAWLVLLPVWVGTGFLVPMAVAILPATLLAPPVADGSAAFAPWVQPMVYGGFAWQGVFLGAAFVSYVRQRWSGAVRGSNAVRGSLPEPGPVLPVVLGGGIAMAVLSAGLQVGAGTLGAVGAVHAVLALAGAGGVLALARGTAHRWLAAAAGWTGSAVMFSWGLFYATITMTGVPLGVGSPLAGLAQLTGLLGGFALAVAGLLVITAAVPSALRVPD